MNPKQRAREAAAKGDLASAKAQAARACRDAPRDPEAWFLLSAVCGGLGDFAEAERCARRALEIAPDNPAALLNLGIAMLRQERAPEAVPVLQRAVALQTANPEAHSQLGNAMHLSGRYDDAVTSYETALRLNPSAAPVRCNLGASLRKLGRPEAVAAYEAATRLDPGMLDAWLGLADSHSDSSRLDGAKRVLMAAMERFPNVFDVYIRLAIVCEELGETQLAAEHFRAALAIRPGDAAARAGFARTLAFLGDDETGLAEFDRLFAAGDESVPAVVSFAHLARRFRREAQARALVHRALETGTDDDSRRRLLFALAKLEDSAGEYDAAFGHVEEANRLKRAGFDRGQWRRQIEEIVTAYSPGVCAHLPRSAIASRRPIFIVGMPRSGTSLVEQILASHPAVFGAGELNDITNHAESLPREAGGRYPSVAAALSAPVLERLGGQYLTAHASRDAGSRYVTDKAPGNFEFLGFIAQLLPGARVIHCMRDPLDTCLSCYFQDFSGAHAWAYDLGNLGYYYRGYERLMHHWRAVNMLPILDVRYEELVTATEATARQMLEFLDLPWDPRCLKAHASRRVVATASHDQVREPIYSRSLQRWRGYEHHLAPLREALADAKGVFDSP